MSMQRSKPRRPAWLYPVDSVLALRDGREFVVDEQEFRYYDEFGKMREKDYLYSKWKRYWRRVK